MFLKTNVYIRIAIIYMKIIKENAWGTTTVGYNLLCYLFSKQGEKQMSSQDNCRLRYSSLRITLSFLEWLINAI